MRVETGRDLYMVCTLCGREYWRSWVVYCSYDGERLITHDEAIQRTLKWREEIRAMVREVLGGVSND